MALSASASTFPSNSFSVYNYNTSPPLFIPSSSASSFSNSTKILAYNGPLGKPICAKYCGNNLSSIIVDNSNFYKKIKKSTNFRTSVSFQGDSAPQGSIEDDSTPDDSTVPEKQAHFSKLKSIMKLYKEAILIGDEDTISEIEAVICTVEQEQIELVKKVSVLSAEIKSGKEKYVRLQADFDNFRKRSEKERLTVRSDAQGEVIESLLPMVDNFERAKQQLKPDTEKEKKIDSSYQGIYKQFVEIMRSLRVAAIPTVGKPFDPSIHEAIAREESAEYKEGIVIQEFRRGFRLGDRLLRPAMVKVSSGLREKQPSHVAGKSSEQPATVAGADER